MAWCLACCEARAIGWSNPTQKRVKNNSDISICTRERIGIVIELKYVADGNLAAACAKALKQIEGKNMKKY